MCRTISLRSVLWVIVLGCSTPLFQGARADAQVQNMGPPSVLMNFTRFPLSPAFPIENDAELTYSDGGTATDLSAGNTVHMNLAGDWSVRLSRNIAGAPPGWNYAGVVFYITLPFSVGNLPVLVEDMQLAWDAKWVHGGGDALEPTTKWNVGAIVQEPASPGSQYFALELEVVTNGEEFVGNGYWSRSGVLENAASYVLAANTNYELFLYGETRSELGSVLGEFQPTITVTHEFGGALSGGSFSGFDVSFVWQTVPEPSAIGLAVVATAGAAFLALPRPSAASANLKRLKLATVRRQATAQRPAGPTK